MDETSTLLASWGTPQDVIEKFRDNDIHIEHFKDLNEMYLKELCPHIGHRMKLRSNIQDLLDSFAETETAVSSISTNCTNTEEPKSVSFSKNDNNSLDDIIIEDMSLPNLSFDIDSLLNKEHRPPLPEFDIKTLLQTSAHGNSILSYYKQYKTLNAKKRNALVDIVVKHIYTYAVHNNLKPEDYNLLAAKILAVFPSESISSYYMKAVSTLKSCTGKYIPAKGKLVDKVRNLLYISEAKRRTSKLNTDEEKENVESAEGNENIPDTSDDVLWLNTNNEPWEEVINKWDKTFAKRQKSKLSTVHEYLEKWKILKNEKGHLLINLDFERLYKEQSINFYKYWESFFGKLLKLKQSQLTNENALQILETLNAVTDNDKKIPLQMTLLGYLVPPKGRLSRKIKFSSSEAIEEIIVQTHNAGDIDSIVENQKKKAASRNLTVQPYVLLLGSLHEYSALYIVIDDIKYQLHSAAKAFDLLFKIYHVFHVKYPQASSHLYLIIQKKIYGITTCYDIIPPHIVEILNL